MSTEYDLDLNNYSISDIETFLRLDKKNYSLHDIEQKKVEMLSMFRNSNNEVSIKVCKFIMAASGKLRIYKKGAESRETDYSLQCTTIDNSLKYTPFKDTLPSHRERNTRELDEIVHKPVPDFKTVFQNEFNPGKMNPLHTPVLTKCLNIDTRFRENLYTTQSSNFTFTLPTTIKKVVSMCLSSYELPVTFYGISASYGNNYFYIKCTYKYPSMSDYSTTSKTIIIPDGNYSAPDLIILINSALRPLNADGTMSDTSLTSTTSIFNCIQLLLDLSPGGSGSGIISIKSEDANGFSYASSISSIGLNFTLNIDGVPDLISVTTRVGWNLGFIKPKYDSVGTTLPSIAGDTLPEPASLRYIYLVVNDFNNSVNNQFIGAFSNWVMNSNILARIPINAQYFNILMENDVSQHLEPRKYFGPVDIQRMQIQLLDDHGRILNINKANFSLCLTFKTLYD